jgi:excisionase family DNA binding protein
MAKQGMSVKEAAAYLGVTPSWIEDQIASGRIKPKKGRGKYSGKPYLSKADREKLGELWSRSPIPEVEPLSDMPSDDLPPAVSTLLARYSDLEAERANLLAQIAWERALARERETALDLEQKRGEQLSADLEVQRRRVEALKALSTWDRMLGRHKSI